MATPTQSESLKTALSFDRPSLSSGAVLLSQQGCYLWYCKENPRCVCVRSTLAAFYHSHRSCRFMNSASATPDDLDSLPQRAILPPFLQVRGQCDFDIQLDLAASGLIEVQFLHSETENMSYISSKFTAVTLTRDISRADIFVLIQKRARSSRTTVLRKKDREWKFDATSLTVTCILQRHRTGGSQDHQWP